MRIISGEARGRRLFTPKDETVTRPTSDRTREAIFNIISMRVRGAKVLDMFAGTGAMGLEALSRGAVSAVFVDRSAEAASLIKRNADVTGFSGRSRMMRTDAEAAARSLDAAGERFDIIFMDPPYASDVMDRLFASGSAEKLLADGGIIVAEHGREKELSVPAGLCIKDKRAYGIASVSFIEREGET